jgi:RHH-type proline utilization regulon transcriptional repressor/proline dehydrogenase/delta 1-pyrroline-5-carboxylate dehydrogenase
MMTAALEYRYLEGDEFVSEVESLVKQWLAKASTTPVNTSVRRLSGILRDPVGLDFTVGFIDRVVRPEDVRAAASNLREVTSQRPTFLPWHLRLALRAGAMASLVAPGLTIPVVRRALRHMVSHLLIGAEDAKLSKMIARIESCGAKVNINLLGEAVLGDKEATRRRQVGYQPPRAFSNATTSTMCR